MKVYCTPTNTSTSVCPYPPNGCCPHLQVVQSKRILLSSAGGRKAAFIVPVTSTVRFCLAAMKVVARGQSFLQISHISYIDF